MSFSSGSESRDIIRGADLLRKRVPRRKTFDHRILYGQSCQKMSKADGQRCKNGKKVIEVGWRVSRHTVVASTYKFVLDTRVNGVANEEKQGEEKCAHI